MKRAELLVTLNRRQRKRFLLQEAQGKRSIHGWPNWYINRGRMSFNPTKRELRMVSWRRAH